VSYSLNNSANSSFASVILSQSRLQASYIILENSNSLIQASSACCFEGKYINQYGFFDFKFFLKIL
jgi:hypothetical protein